MNREEILETLTQDILAYVMAGDFPERQFAQTVKPTELDERFNDYELLLDLHFILREDVVQFVEALPTRLRRIRTETDSTSNTSRGAIDGRINWNATFKQRYSRNPRDKSVFVIDNRTIDFDIPENIVLIQLLQVIQRTLQQADSYLRREYDWVQKRWHENGGLIDDLAAIMDRNVNIRRIRDPESYEPTERMLTTADNSRQEIYRDAAALLRARDRLFRGDQEELQRLLEFTAIAPDDRDRLFELYVLFRFVSILDDLRSENVVFETIATDRQAVAHLPGSPEIAIYHDNSARDRNVSFRTEAEADLHDPIPRSHRVQQVAQEVAQSYFKKDFEDHTGRPDVIILEVRDEENDDYEYLITEVKNSKREKTIRQGIKETLEYLAFLRVNEDFVFEKESDTSEYFGSGWNGLLVIQDMDRDVLRFEEQASAEQPIRILQAGDVEDGVRTALEQLGIN
ncbi:MAG: hypothetical protein ABEH59_05315 [Halobacteriales archaeon]